MNEQQKQEFINNEIEALYEELNDSINKLVMLRPFFQDLLKVIHGGESSYKFGEIFHKDEVEAEF